MSEKNVRLLRTVYGSVLTFLLILTGLCLILSALSIYHTGGEKPYTPEAISAHFGAIAIPVWVTLGAILAGIVLSLVLPKAAERPRAWQDRRAILLRTAKRRNALDGAYLTVARAESLRRRILRVGTGVLVLLLAIPAILHLSSPESFRYPEYNESVIAAMPTLLLFSLGACVLLTVSSLLCDRSYARQTEALLRTERTAPAASETPTASGRVTLTVRLVLLAAALLLLTVGILGGGMADVLSKAINICTECIGLG